MRCSALALCTLLALVGGCAGPQSTRLTADDFDETPDEFAEYTV